MELKIICQKCKYYYVTWEKSNPHGCKAYGFKSKIIPSVIVKRTSGDDCNFFEKKNLNN